MNPLYKPAAVTLTALALAALPTTALAHHGQPFKNCTAAYEAGHANIPKGDEHYKPALDRDGDGIGCDKPPSGFVPADDEDEQAGAEETEEPSAPAEGGGEETPDEKALAETGGNSTTPWIAAGGAAVVLAGGGLVLVNRKRRATR